MGDLSAGSCDLRGPGEWPSYPLGMQTGVIPDKQGIP